MTTADNHSHEATIEAEKDTPAISITREFAATIAQLRQAHTDPDLFVRWVGPHGVDSRVDRWDCRTLGSYRYVCVEDGEEHWFRGTFPEVSEDRLVQTFCYEPMPEMVTLETMTFTDLGGGRSRLHARSIYDSFEARDGMLASGMDTGVNHGYEKLDLLLGEGLG